MLQSQESIVINLHLDINWNKLVEHREWLLSYNDFEAITLVQFIDEMWIDDIRLHWPLIQDQKQWLSTFDNPTATELLHLLELVQDRAVNSEQVSLDDIYGQSQPVKRQKPTHLKLVVKNYFQPRERIDQPPKPEPVLTLV